MSTTREQVAAPGQVIAAVDLGSNSFHMVVARLDGGQLVIVDRLREMVRLGAGLEPGGTLSEVAAARGLACRAVQRRLAICAQPASARSAPTPCAGPRPRRFRNARSRTRPSHRRDLGRRGGAPGLSGRRPQPAKEPGDRLVVDIGGGSTELIVGGDYVPRTLESLYMGCVSISQEFFNGGRVSPGRFRKARLAVRQELEPVIARFRGEGWARAYGTSGTIRSAARQLVAEGNPSGIITRERLDKGAVC